MAASLSPTALKAAPWPLVLVWAFCVLFSIVVAAALLPTIIGFACFLATALFFNLTLSPGRWKLLVGVLLPIGLSTLVISFLAILSGQDSAILVDGQGLNINSPVGIVAFTAAILDLISSLVFAGWTFAAGVQSLFQQDLGASTTAGATEASLARSSNTGAASTTGGLGKPALSSRYLSYRAGRSSLTSPLRDEDSHGETSAAAAVVASSSPSSTGAAASSSKKADADEERSSRGSGLSLPPIRKAEQDEGAGAAGVDGGRKASAVARGPLDAVAEAVDSGALAAGMAAASSLDTSPSSPRPFATSFRVVANRPATQTIALALFGLLACAAIFQLTTVGLPFLCLALLALLEFGLFGRGGRWLCFSRFAGSCASASSRRGTNDNHLSSSSSYLLRSWALVFMRLYSFAVLFGLFAAQIDWDGGGNSGSGDGCPAGDGSLPVQLGFICSFLGSAGIRAWPFAVSYCCVALLHVLAGLTQAVLLPALIRGSHEAAMARRLYHHYHQARSRNQGQRGAATQAVLSGGEMLDAGVDSSAAEGEGDGGVGAGDGSGRRGGNKRGAFLLSAGDYRHSWNSESSPDLPVVSSLTLSPKTAAKQQQAGTAGTPSSNKKRPTMVAEAGKEAPVDRDRENRDGGFSPSAAAFLSPAAAIGATPSFGAGNEATPKDGDALPSEQPQKASLVQRVTSSTKAAVRMVMLFLLGSDLGFGLVCVAILCWSTAFPSLLTLAPLLWVLLCGCTYSHFSASYHAANPSASPKESSRITWVGRLARMHHWLRSDVPMSCVLWYVAAVAVAQYAAALVAVWQQPALFDPSTSGSANPWSSAIVKSLYSGGSGLVGFAPETTSPSFQQLYHLALLALLGGHLRCRAIFVKEKSTRQLVAPAASNSVTAAGGSVAAQSAESSARVLPTTVAVAAEVAAADGSVYLSLPGDRSDQHGGSGNDVNDDDDDDGLGGTGADYDGADLDESSSAFLVDEAEAARRAYEQLQEQLKETGRILWTLGQGWMVFVILLALYLLSLFSVDLVHAVYVCFIVAFAINPRLRREKWRWLIAANTVAIVLMFLLDILALNILNGSSSTIPPWVAGSEIVDPGVTLWNVPFTTNLAIFALCVIQAPHYDRENSGEHAQTLEQLHARHPWIPRAERAVIRFQVDYGSWVVYLAFVAISLVPPVELMSMTTLVLVSVSLVMHLFRGVSRSTKHVPSMLAVGRMLLVLAVVEGVFLGVRYLYQFTPIARWFETSIGPEIASVIRVVELGLCNESIDNGTTGGGGGQQQKCPTNLYLDLLDTTILFFMAVMQQRAVFSAVSLRKKALLQSLSASLSSAASAASSRPISLIPAPVSGHARDDSIGSASSGKALLPSATASSAPAAAASSSASAAPVPGRFAFPLNEPSSADGAVPTGASIATWEEETANAIARWTYKRSPGLAQASLAALAALLVACITSSLPVGTSAGAGIAVLVLLLISAILVHDLRRHGAHSHRLRGELKLLREQGLIVPPPYYSQAPPPHPAAATGSAPASPAKRPRQGSASTPSSAARPAASPGPRSLVAAAAGVSNGASGNNNTNNAADQGQGGEEDRATVTAMEAVGCWRWFWYKLCCGCCCSPRRTAAAASSQQDGDGPSVTVAPTCGTVLKRFFKHSAHLLRHFLYRHSGQITMVTGFAVATTNVDAMSLVLVILIVVSTLFTGVRESWQACGGVRCSEGGCRRKKASTAASNEAAATNSAPVAAMYSPLSGGENSNTNTATNSNSGNSGISSRRRGSTLDEDGHGDEKREEDRLLCLLRGLHHGTFLSSSYASTSAVSKPSFYWAWLPLLVGVWAAILLKYAFQFSFFAHSSNNSKWYSGGTAMTEWLGLYRLDYPAASAATGGPPNGSDASSYTYSGMWALLGPYLWIVIACALQRWSADFGTALLAEEAEDLEILSRALDGLEKQQQQHQASPLSASSSGAAGIVARRASIRAPVPVSLSAADLSSSGNVAASVRGINSNGQQQQQQQQQQYYYYHGHAYPSFTAALQAQRAFEFVFMSLLMALGIEELVGSGSGSGAGGITRSSFAFSPGAASAAAAAASGAGSGSSDSSGSSLTVADVSLLRQLSRPVHGRGLLTTDVPFLPLPYLWTERRMAGFARGIVADADEALSRSAPVSMSSLAPVGGMRVSSVSISAEDGGRSVSVGSLKDKNKNARVSLAVNSRAVISFGPASASSSSLSASSSASQLPALSPSLRMASSNLLVDTSSLGRSGPGGAGAFGAGNGTGSVSGSSERVLTVVDWYQRALHYRRFMGLTEGADKLARKYSASLMQDATVVALVFSAMLLLNLWGVMQVVFALLALRPWSSPSTAAVHGSYEHQQKQHQGLKRGGGAVATADTNGRMPFLSSFCSRFLWPSESFLRSWIWPFLRLYLAVMLLALYTACLGWYPAITSWVNWWPWTMSAQEQYWVAGIGLNGFGTKPLGLGQAGSGSTYFLFPCYVALLCAGAASKQWSSIDAARRRSVEATTAALSASSSSSSSRAVPVVLSSSSGSATAPTIAAGAGADEAAVSASEAAAKPATASSAPTALAFPGPGPNSGTTGANNGSSSSGSSWASDWDRLQYLVASTSAQLLLVAIFIIAAVNSFQDLFLLGYCFISLFFLYAPRYYTKKGNAVLGWVRIYTMLVLLFNLLYQVPTAPVPPACTIIDNSPGPSFGKPIVVEGFCLSWQSLFGFRKLSSFEPAAPPVSNANFTFPPSSANPALWANGANPLCPISTSVSTATAASGLASVGDYSAPFAVHDFFIGSLAAVPPGSTSSPSCPSPFNSGTGLLTSFLLVILGICQAYIFDSSAYACAQDIDLAEQRLAATRRALNDAMRKQRQIDKNTEGLAEAASRERRLQRLIDRTNKWDISNSIGPDGVPLCPPAMQARLWPPIAPAKVLSVTQIGDGAVRILWLPPPGYALPPPSASLLTDSADTPTGASSSSSLLRQRKGKAVAIAGSAEANDDGKEKDEDNGLRSYLLKRQQSRRLMASSDLPFARDLGFIIKVNRVASNVGGGEEDEVGQREGGSKRSEGAVYGDWDVAAVIHSGQANLTATTHGVASSSLSSSSSGASGGTRQCFVATIRDLEENCCFEFAVAARSELGIGPYSEASLPIVIQPPLPLPSESAAGWSEKKTGKVTLVFDESRQAKAAALPQLGTTTAATGGSGSAASDDLLGIRSPTADAASSSLVATATGIAGAADDSGEATSNTAASSSRRPRRASASGSLPLPHREASEKGSVIAGMAHRAESVVMAGAEDVKRCCGCERGCGGWMHWLFFKIESAFLPKIDRLLYPRPVAGFRKGIADCQGIFCCGGGSGGRDVGTNASNNAALDGSDVPLIAQQQQQQPQSQPVGPGLGDGLAAAKGLLYLAATGAHGVDEDWAVESEKYSFFPSRLLFILYVIYLSVVSHSQILVLTAIIIYTCVSASILACVVAFLLFFHLLSEYPRPGHHFWAWLSRYVLVVIVLKFLFQLPIFCLQMHTNASMGTIDGTQWYPSLWFLNGGDGCVASSIGAATAALHVQVVSLIGITKYSTVYGGQGFLSGLWPDLLLLVALLFHRSMLQRKGLWKTAKRADSRILRKAVEAAYGLKRSSAARVAEGIVAMGASSSAPADGDGGAEGTTVTKRAASASKEAATGVITSPFEALAAAKEEERGAAEDGDEGGPSNATPATALSGPSASPSSGHGARKPKALHLVALAEDAGEGEHGDNSSDNDDDDVAEEDGEDGGDDQAPNEGGAVLTGLSNDPVKGLTPRYSSGVFSAATSGAASSSGSVYLKSQEDGNGDSSSGSSCSRCCCGCCCEPGFWCGCFPFRASLKRMLTPPSEQPNVKAAGRDLYLWAFSVQLLILLFLIAFPAVNIDPSTSSMSVVQQLSQNQFSGSMVLLAVMMIALIVVERVAYLLRSHLLKFVIHCTTVVVVHFFIFFAIPWTSNRPFVSNPSLIVFYLFWALYFSLGALQLHHGYETRPPRDSLKSNGYNAPMPLLFTIYLSVPFLHELRQILDWVCTPTSLDLPQWMKVEAIHTQLFLVQSDMVSRQRNRKEWFGKLTQSSCYKFWCGTVIFLALLLVIIGPALLFSTLNPTLSLNPVTAVGLNLELQAPDEGTFPIFQTTHYQSLGAADNPADYQYLTGGASYFSQLQQNSTINGLSPIPDSWKPLTQQMLLYPFPLSAWSLSPPALSNLIGLLVNAVNTTGGGLLPNGGGAVNPSASTGVSLSFQLAFSRAEPVGNEVISTSYTIPLTAGVCATLVQTIIAATTATSSTANVAAIASVFGAGAGAERLAQVIGSAVNIPDAYPLALRLPATGSALPIGEASRSIALTLHRLNPNSTSNMPSLASLGSGTGSPVPGPSSLGVQPYYSSLPLWWTLQLSSLDPYAGGGGPNNSTAGGLVFNVISDKVAPSVLVSSFGGYSILAIYVTVVLAVGRLIRSAWGSDPARVPVEEMADCTDLLELCQGLRAAQRSSYDGCHVDEMTLYRVLVRIFRSPEMLLRATAPKHEW